MVCISYLIAAAPRPLRLRRGFEVTTAPLNSLFAIGIIVFICSATQHRNVIKLFTIISYDLYYIYLFKIISIQEIRNRRNLNKKNYLFVFHFSKGSATALTVGAPPIVESFSFFPIYNLQIRPRQVQFCHKITYFAILQNFIF